MPNIDRTDIVKVLLADDHPAFCEGVHRALDETDDLEVVGVAEDGEQAVRLTQKLAPDVVVINIAMPKLNGIEATKQIRANCPNVAIIIISSYTHGSYVIPALRAGALGYLLKTSPLAELLNSIRWVRTGETVFDSKAAGKVLRLIASGVSEERKDPERLHYREMDVLKLIAKGMHNKDIATELLISEHTVHTHLTNIFRKLGVRSRTEAVLHALKEGWLTFDDLP